MNGKSDNSSRIKLPPRLPQNEEDLELTIKLLGNRKQCELGIQARKRLENLIGVYPTVKEASLWKRILRRVYHGEIQISNQED